MRVDVRADIKSVQQILSATQRQCVPKAAARALNKTLNSVMAVAAREIKQEVGNGLAISVIKASLTKIKATPRKLYAALCAQGRRLPISKLDPKARQTKTGVSYKINRHTKKQIAHAFIATMKSGHRGVFKRKTTARLPIVELLGPSLPKVFTNAIILKALEKITKERWVKTFQQELNYELRKFK